MLTLETRVDAREKAGWACHFVVDVGQLLHTGAETSQIRDSSVNFDYESWVADNWTSGEEFSDEIDNSTYYPINSPSQAAKDLSDSPLRDGFSPADSE